MTLGDEIKISSQQINVQLPLMVSEHLIQGGVQSTFLWIFRPCGKRQPGQSRLGDTRRGQRSFGLMERMSE